MEENITINRSNEGQQAKNSTFDKVKSTVSSKLHEAADNLSNKINATAGNNPKAAQYGKQATDWLNRSADYIEELNPQQMKTDLQKQVQSNPGRSLLIAAGVGLVLGSLFRRR